MSNVTEGMEKWNNGTLGKRGEEKIFLFFLLLFHHSNIPLFQDYKGLK
jgi:hypothetical protein